MRMTSSYREMLSCRQESTRRWPIRGTRPRKTRSGNGGSSENDPYFNGGESLRTGDRRTAVTRSEGESRPTGLPLSHEPRRTPTMDHHRILASEDVENTQYSTEESILFGPPRMSQGDDLIRGIRCERRIQFGETTDLDTIDDVAGRIPSAATVVFRRALGQPTSGRTSITQH